MAKACKECKAKKEASEFYKSNWPDVVNEIRMRKND